ncbi:fumarylacetoacetate hydrolase family protein [soil metagenome]
MKLATFRRAPDQAARLGAVDGDTIIDVERLGAAASVSLPRAMLDFIDLGRDALEATAELLGDASAAHAVGVRSRLADVELLAPIPRPRKNVWGIGLNYVAHIDESARSLDTSAEMPTQPVIFTKPPSSVIGPGHPIEHNGRITQQLDWEVELGVVINGRGKGVTADDARSYVFGYTVRIDVSARDARRAGQWIVSKGQDTYCPLGPWIVTADEISDPHDLDLSLTKNGEGMQDSNTKHMYFQIPALISDISQGMTIDPGDIIATGTPEGVGAGREPQEWMWPGDVITATIEGIGSITHPVVRV